MNKLDPTKFHYDTEENRWFTRLEPPGIHLCVPGEADGPDQSVFPLAERILKEFEEFVIQANGYLSLFVDKKYLHIKEPATGEGLSCGFEPNRITIDLYFEDDVYGAWSVTFRQDREQRWWPVAFCREEQ